MATFGKRVDGVDGRRAAVRQAVSMPASMRHSIEPPALSHRERQALGLALAGLTNAQIARTVFIAESTVKSHLSSAFRRLGVHSRREAVALLNSDPALRASVLAALRLYVARAAAYEVHVRGRHPTHGRGYDSRQTADPTRG